MKLRGYWSNYMSRVEVSKLRSEIWNKQEMECIECHNLTGDCSRCSANFLKRCCMWQHVLDKQRSLLDKNNTSTDYFRKNLLCLYQNYINNV